MKSFYVAMISIGLLWGMSSSAFAAECTNIKESVKQCKFEVDTLANGQITVLTSVDPAGFVGQLAVGCSNGKVNVGAGSCAPAKAADCSITAASWSSDGLRCEHESSPHTLQDGVMREILSTGDNEGGVKYHCQDGVAKALTMTCKEPVKKIKPGKSRAMMSAQGVEQACSTRYFDVKTQVDVNSAVMANKALATCQAYVDSPNYEVEASTPFYSGRWSNGSQYSYSTECCVSNQNLACGTALISGATIGGMGEDGEFSLKPTDAQIKSRLCTSGGYTELDEVIGLKNQYSAGSFVVDEWDTLVQCSGNADAVCGDSPGLTVEITSASDCDSATVKGGLIEMPAGQSVSLAKARAYICLKKGFSTIDNIISSVRRVVGDTTDLYEVTAHCSGYSGNDPIMPACPSPEQPPVIEPKTCLTAKVTLEMEVTSRLLSWSKNDYEQELCVANGFTGLDISVSPNTEQLGPYVLKYSGADFLQKVTYISHCSGYKNGDVSPLLPQCGEVAIFDQSIHQTPLTCDTAKMATKISGTLDESTGELTVAPDPVELLSTMTNTLCTSRGFTDLVPGSLTIESQGLLGLTVFDVTAECSGYLNAASSPLLTSCAAKPTLDSLTVIDCDSAWISKILVGELNGLTQDLTNAPSPGRVQSEICVEENYSELLGDPTVVQDSDDLTKFFITARCESYTGTGREACTDSCLGEVISATSLQAKQCFANGLCYENLCAIDPPGPAELCEDCAQSSVTFTVGDNTCVVDKPLFYSGITYDEPFFNNSHNGELDVLCNGNQLTPGNRGTCFKNCAPGLTGWDDKNGIKSCSQNIPASSASNGMYTQGEEVILGTSIAHTGNTTFRCNDGNWEAQAGAVCQLDCEDSVTWGSGLSNSGQSKNGACGTTPARVAHGATGTLDSGTFNATGTASYTCNDGDFEIDNAVCDLDCQPTVSETWGGACMNDLAREGHGGTTVLPHGSNPAHNPLPELITGSATFNCDDGEWSRTDDSCLYVVSIDKGNYGDWTDVVTQTGAWSASCSDYDVGTTFTRVRPISYIVSRTYDEYYRWSDETTSNSVSKTEVKDVIGPSGTDETGSTTTTELRWKMLPGLMCQPLISGNDGRNFVRIDGQACDTEGEITYSQDGEPCEADPRDKFQKNLFYTESNVCYSYTVIVPGEIVPVPAPTEEVENDVAGCSDTLISTTQSAWGPWVRYGGETCEEPVVRRIGGFASDTYVTSTTCSSSEKRSRHKQQIWSSGPGPIYDIEEETRVADYVIEVCEAGGDQRNRELYPCPANLGKGDEVGEPVLPPPDEVM
jgi:hypothetical protein